MSAEDEIRQIKNAMEDLSLGPTTLDGVLDALNELYSLRHRFPPVLAREQAAASRIEALEAALRPWAFEASPDIRFIATHNPESLAGEYAHDTAEFKGLCVFVVADPSWTSHTAQPSLHHAVKNARDALGLSRKTVDD